MNNNISPASNINFQAKLDITKVKGSKHRWQNIARMFEEKTQKYSSDVFLLEGSFKKGLDLNITNNGLLSFEEATIADFASTKLKKLTDNDIVKNLVDIFKHLKKEEAIIEKQNQWAKTLKLDHLDATQNKNNFKTLFPTLGSSDLRLNCNSASKELLNASFTNITHM